MNLRFFARRLAAMGALALTSMAAHAQFASGQLLTAAALNSALASPTITNGTITGLTAPIGVSLGGTGAATATAALANLGGLAKAGGTMTGALAVSYVNPTITFNDSGGANQALLQFQSSGVNTWGLASQGSTSFVIARYVGGVYTDIPFSVNLSSGLVTINDGLSVSGTVSGSGFTSLLSPYLTSATAASTYAPLASPTFTGTVTIPSGASISGYLTTSGAASTYAPLASPALSGTPTAPTATAGTSTTQVATTAFVASSPTITTPTIVGVTSGACASTGNVGECKNSNVPSGSAVSLTSGTPANVTSVPLTAGNWICYGNIAFLAGSTTVSTTEAGWISTVSASNPSAPNSGAYFGLVSLPSTAGGNGNIYPVGMLMVNVSSATTVYLSTFAAFSTSTMSAFGYLNCLRFH
ncbi:hypothetical protein [Paraburkholderia nodosa]|uniref:hypothetical protein n=1 Tax=Paraburkholderia nodosa TaxID=392320 RepID=UPI000841B261|nr:hypothetical protein [Paraburkholderia nodosa]